MRTILLIRHGSTLLNHEDSSIDRVRGWQNIGLSEQGKIEAAGLAVKVSRYCPDALLSSDLKRAKQTAAILAKYSGMSLQKPTKDFRPWNVGEFVGRKSSEVVPILVQYVMEDRKSVV